MYKNISFSEYSKEAIEQISKAAFLTAKDGDKENTMTIGWGTIGYIWGKPIMTVAVRYSRHTYDLMKYTNEFTVSIPLNGQLKKELAICGTKSGSNIDKFTECELKTAPGQQVNVPIIDDCDLHYECKVVYKQAMEPANVDKQIDDKFYPNNNYHIMFYGEIVACYIKE